MNHPLERPIDYYTISPRALRWTWRILVAVLLLGLVVEGAAFLATRPASTTPSAAVEQLGLVLGQLCRPAPRLEGPGRYRVASR